MRPTVVRDDATISGMADVALVPKSSAGVLVKAINKRHGYDTIVVKPVLATRLGFGPKIRHIYFYDASQDADKRWIDLIHLDQRGLSLVDRNTSATSGVTGIFPNVALDTKSVLNAWATADFLYICFSSPAGGIGVDLVNLNADASTLAAQYLGSAGFAAVASLSDGTDSGGATMGTTAASSTVPSGVITWTPSAAWSAQNLREKLNDQTAPNERGYWGRLSVGTALDAAVSITQIVALVPQAASATAVGRSTMVAATEYVRVLATSVGGLEYIAVAGADTTMDISWFKSETSRGA